MNWIARQYADIKGNLKWAILALIWTAIDWSARHLVTMIPNVPAWAPWATTLVVAAIVFVAMPSYLVRERQNQGSAQKSATNTLMRASENFDATHYFETAFVSSLRTEIENNVRTAAAQNRPNDHEGFYVDLIASGLPGFVYDLTWAYIFRSQILLLQELNRNVLSLAQAKNYYEKAAAENQTSYHNYSFERWLNFIGGEGLLLHHPSGIIEITVRGRDFLKYLVHCGRSAEDRTL